MPKLCWFSRLYLPSSNSTAKLMFYYTFYFSIYLCLQSYYNVSSRKFVWYTSFKLIVHSYWDTNFSCQNQQEKYFWFKKLVLWFYVFTSKAERQSWIVIVSKHVKEIQIANKETKIQQREIHKQSHMEVRWVIVIAATSFFFTSIKRQFAKFSDKLFKSWRHGSCLFVEPGFTIWWQSDDEFCNITGVSTKSFENKSKLYKTFWFLMILEVFLFDMHSRWVIVGKG